AGPPSGPGRDGGQRGRSGDGRAGLGGLSSAGVAATTGAACARADLGQQSTGRADRDFLKTALRHLVIDHWRQKKKEKDKGPRPLGKGGADARTAVAGVSDDDPVFINAWREALLAQTWKALAQFEEVTGQPHHTLLRAKFEQPELRSAQLAQQQGARL